MKFQVQGTTIKTLQLEQAKFEAAEYKMGAKYHRVKFFERQKLQRALNKIQRTLANTTGSETDFGAAAILHPDAVAKVLECSGSKREDALRGLLKLIQTDLIYVKWYPRHLRYIALLPSA